MQDLRWDEVRSVIDVGANVGAATLWFATRAPRARVVAVEPTPATVSSLLHNVNANGLTARIEVLPVAVGSNSGMGVVKSAGSSTAATVDSSVGAVGSPVRIISLEQLLDEAGIAEPDVLKLDCEGAEFDVLLSSDERILTRNRIIMGEYHTTNRSEIGILIDRLEKAGFSTTSSAPKLMRGFADSMPSEATWIGLFQAVRRDR